MPAPWTRPPLTEPPCRYTVAHQAGAVPVHQGHRPWLSWCLAHISFTDTVMTSKPLISCQCFFPPGPHKETCSPSGSVHQDLALYTRIWLYTPGSGTAHPDLAGAPGSGTVKQMHTQSWKKKEKNICTVLCNKTTWTRVWNWIHTRSTPAFVASPHSLPTCLTSQTCGGTLLTSSSSAAAAATAAAAVKGLTSQTCGAHVSPHLQ